MSIALRDSLLATSSLLPSFATAARQSNPPTYAEHLDSLTEPERAFIVDQARLLGNVGSGNSKQKTTTSEAISHDPDIERLQRLVDDAARRHHTTANQQTAPTANGWRILLTIVVLFALPAVFAALAAITTNFPYSSECNGRRQAKVQGTATYFGIAVGWLLVWSLLRTWKHKSRNKPSGPGAKFSVFWTFFIWIGYCVAVAYIWVKSVCMWL